MTDNTIFSIRWYLVGAIATAIWLLLAWDHFHGGVPNHHLLAREDLPAVSNWWGGILVPILTWFLLYRIQKRMSVDNANNSHPLTNHSDILYGFFGALLFGVALSLFFTFENEDMPFYMLMALFVLALFKPVYRAECFLGFLLGMTYTFGGVLPVGIGAILVLLCAILYLLIRPTILFVFKKIVAVNK